MAIKLLVIHFLEIMLTKCCSKIYCETHKLKLKKDVKASFKQCMLTAGIRLDGKEKEHLLKNIREWHPPHKLPQFKKIKLVNTQMPVLNQSAKSIGPKLNESRRGLGRLGKRKRQERLSDSEEECEAEEEFG